MSSASQTLVTLRSAGAGAWLGRGPGPLLSVVVPVHNVDQWLDELLYSVLSQDLDDLEVIAVDDHSSDRSREILDRHAQADPRVRILAPSDHGGGNARNMGAMSARGRYLVFADADDIVPAGAYRALVDSLERTGSDIAFGDFLKFSNTRIWRPSLRWGVFDEPRERTSVEKLPQLLRGRACWNKVFRAQFWRDAAIVFPDVPRSNDIVPMVKAYLAAPAVDVVPVTSYLYRERPGSTSMSAKSHPMRALESYLDQELECARMVQAMEQERALYTYSSVFLVSDGWVHLHDFAMATPPDDAALSDSARDNLRSIVEGLTPRVFTTLELRRRVAFTLWLSAHDAEARDVLMAEAAEESTPETLGAWVAAIEALVGQGADPAMLSEAWETRVIKPLSSLAQAGASQAEPLLARISALAPSMAPVDARRRGSRLRAVDAAVRELAPMVLAAWLDHLHDGFLVASTVERVGRDIRVSGLIPAGFAAAAPSAALVRAQHTVSSALPVEMTTDAEGTRWAVMVRPGSPHVPLPVTVKVSWGGSADGALASTVVLDENVVLPAAGAGSALAVYRRDDAALEIVARGGVIARGTRRLTGRR